MSARTVVRTLIPFAVRVELIRLRRLPGWIRERRCVALGKTQDVEGFRWTLATHESPLRRESGVSDERLQRGKEQNVARASSLINGIVVPPGGVFSYHHAVGRPSRLRGFRLGLELQRGEMGKGVGGGCCQVSNMLYLLALRAGLRIVERHRHGLDLFPDHGRTVPFGCGATVFYNYADFRFENTLDQDVAILFRIEDGRLVGELRTANDPGWTVEVYERDHRFERDGEGWRRENRVCRRFIDPSGQVLADEEVAHNVGRVLYDPEAVP